MSHLKTMSDNITQLTELKITKYDDEKIVLNVVKEVGYEGNPECPDIIHTDVYVTWSDSTGKKFVDVWHHEFQHDGDDNEPFELEYTYIFESSNV